MNARWITTLADFAAVRPEWEAGLRAAGARNPALLPEFILAWSRRFVRDGDLRIFLLRDGDGVAAGWPLYRCRWPGRLPWRVLRPIGVDSADLNDPFLRVSRHRFLRHFAAALQQLPGWRFLYVPLLRELASDDGAGADSLDDSRARAFLESAGLSARLELAGTAAQYWGGRSAALRGNIRYYEKRAAQCGTVRLSQYRDPDKLASLTRTHLEWMAPRVAFTAHTPTAWPGFVLELTAALARRGALEAQVLTIDDATAATSLWVRFDDCLHGLWFSFNPRFAHLSPGTLLLHRFIDWSWQNRIREIEFTCDEGFAWKRRWMNAAQPIYRLHWFHPGRFGQLQAHLWRARTAVSVRSSPRPEPSPKGALSFPAF